MKPKDYINFVELERMRFYRGLYNAWVKELNKPAIELINKLKTNPGLVSSIENNLPNSDGVKDLFVKTWQMVGSKFANNTYNTHHKCTSFEIRVKQANASDGHWIEYMRNFALTEAGQRITWINQTTDEELLKIVRESLNRSQELGEGIDVIARNLRKDLINDYGQLSMYRAQRIARTEIIGAGNRGSLLGAQSLGYNMNKTWFSMIDNATRTIGKSEFDHVNAHGETVGIYDYFKRTGEDMQSPGDPKGSAGNVINCRCAQTFVVL